MSTARFERFARTSGYRETRPSGTAQALGALSGLADVLIAAQTQEALNRFKERQLGIEGRRLGSQIAASNALIELRGAQTAKMISETPTSEPRADLTTFQGELEAADDLTPYTRRKLSPEKAEALSAEIRQRADVQTFTTRAKAVKGKSTAQTTLLSAIEGFADNPETKAIRAMIQAGNIEGASTRIGVVAKRKGGTILSFSELIEAQRGLRLSLEALEYSEAITPEERTGMERQLAELGKAVFARVKVARGKEKETILTAIMEEVTKLNPNFNQDQIDRETKKIAVERGMKFPGTI